MHCFHIPASTFSLDPGLPEKRMKSSQYSRMSKTFRENEASGSSMEFTQTILKTFFRYLRSIHLRTRPGMNSRLPVIITKMVFVVFLLVPLPGEGCMLLDVVDSITDSHRDLYGERVQELTYLDSQYNNIEPDQLLIQLAQASQVDELHEKAVALSRTGQDYQAYEILGKLVSESKKLVVWDNLSLLLARFHKREPLAELQRKMVQSGFFSDEQILDISTTRLANPARTLEGVLLLEANAELGRERSRSNRMLGELALQMNQLSIARKQLQLALVQSKKEQSKILIALGDIAEMEGRHSLAFLYYFLGIQTDPSARSLCNTMTDLLSVEKNISRAVQWSYLVSMQGSNGKMLRLPSARRSMNVLQESLSRNMNLLDSEIEETLNQSFPPAGTDLRFSSEAYRVYSPYVIAMIKADPLASGILQMESTRFCASATGDPALIASLGSTILKRDYRADLSPLKRFLKPELQSDSAEVRNRASENLDSEALKEQQWNALLVQWYGHAQPIPDEIYKSFELQL